MVDSTREITALLMLSLIPILGLFAWRAVRKRRLGQEDMLGQLGKPATSIISYENSSEWVDGFYVATTFSEDPLQRVWAHGLGARGRGRFLVEQGNILLDRIGEPPLFISADQIVRSARGSATIDRATESGGLLQIHWMQNGIELITSLRILDSKRREAFKANIRSQN